MKNWKSPGNDGFTKEFYISFFCELGPLLLKTFNYSFEKGEFGCITKASSYYFNSEKNRDVMLIKHWMQIS